VSRGPALIANCCQTRDLAFPTHSCVDLAAWRGSNLLDGACRLEMTNDRLQMTNWPGAAWFDSGQRALVCHLPSVICHFLGRAEIFALPCSYPAKFAALEMARSAKAVIRPAKIADAPDGNEPKEN
jgi:hypothetical protein